MRTCDAYLRLPISAKLLRLAKFSQSRSLFSDGHFSSLADFSKTVDMTSFYYFAYGSNMLRNRLCERCPSARVVSSAILNGWELKWHKKSKDGSGKCDIVQSETPGGVVYGVLYEIDYAEKPTLDKAEGLGNGYKDLQIILNSHPNLSVTTYQASNIDAEIKPYTWYRELVLAGAEENKLPDIYIEGLRSIPSIEDSDRERHDKNIRILK
jgi:hypothetical protein